MKWCREKGVFKVGLGGVLKVGLGISEMTLGCPREFLGSSSDVFGIFLGCPRDTPRVFSGYPSGVLGIDMKIDNGNFM